MIGPDRNANSVEVFEIGRYVGVPAQAKNQTPSPFDQVTVVRWKKVNR
jgi:hypothetical protein